MSPTWDTGLTYMDTREYSIQHASKDLMFITILQDYLLPITKAGFIGLTIYKHGNVTIGDLTCQKGGKILEIVFSVVIF